jgi:hypothetical protein
MPTISPYPGLRPFREDESDIFFGREEQTDELLKKLGKNRFLAIVGSSGCGKSSLAKAGMISALKTGFMAPAGARWQIAVLRPGSHPIKRLAEALIIESALGIEKVWGTEGVSFLDSTLRRGPLGLVEALRQSPILQNTNLLILVDQFEEIFRLRTRENRDEQDAFIELILETSRQREFPVYIVITMRSDYLGDCAIFHGLPETLNASQYLTPRMTREQREEAIIGPARVFCGEVEPALINRLLNESGTDPNQLPILQHALMRMWSHTSTQGECKRSNIFLEEVPKENLGHVLTISDYESVGGLSKALSLHADEAFNELSDEQKRIAEILFRSLCERGTERRDGRHPTAVNIIADRAGVALDQIIKVVEVFRNPVYGFLVPAPPEVLYENTVIDITHESLIKIWKRLNEWVEKEVDSAETYKRLVQTALLKENKKAALYGTPDLEDALAWKERERPLKAWAERYGGNFEIAMKFLKDSEEEQKRIKEKAEAEHKQKLKRTRITAISFGLIAVLLAGIIISYLYLYKWDYVGYYNNFMKFRGEPRGVGELTLKQVLQRKSSLKFKREGRWGHVIRMEAVNSRGELTKYHGVGTILEQSADYIPKEVAWEFSYDESGNVTYEIALDDRGNRIRGFVYLPDQPNRKETRTGYFVDENGYPKQDRKYSNSFVEHEFKKTKYGIEEYVRYRNRAGQPVRGPDKAFGRFNKYDLEGHLTEMTSLGPDDQPMNDEFGNAILSLKKVDDMGNPQEEFALDASRKITNTTEGWSIKKIKYDEAGNAIEVGYFDSDGQPTLHVKGYHKVSWKFDDMGNVVLEKYFDTAKNPTIGEMRCYSVSFEYDKNGNCTKQKFYGPNNNLCFNRDGYAIWNAKYDSLNRIVEISYYDRNGKSIPNNSGYASFKYSYGFSDEITETNYFNSNGNPTLIKEGYSRSVREHNDQGQIIRVSYYGINGKPIILEQGYARWEQDYDGYGNVLNVRYYDTGGKLTLNKEGYAGYSSKFDASGNGIEVIYLNIKNEPTLLNEGYSGWRSDFDSKGNEVKNSFIGLKGELILTTDKIAGSTSKYDLLGNEIKREYFGLNGEPVIHREGYSKWTKKYDERGNVIEIRYFNIWGKPVIKPWDDVTDHKYPGYAAWVGKYNSQNKLKEETYLGIKGEFILNKNGWAHSINRYDSRGNNVESEYFGINDEHALNYGGYHSVNRHYNDQGNITQIRYFDVNGKPTACNDGYAYLVKEYDPYGRLTEQKLYNKKDEPTTLKGEVFHLEKRKYDDRGQLIEYAYFGKDRTPVLYSKGYHAIRYVYDNQGKTTSEQYLGKDGKLIQLSEGYAGIDSKYDQRGNLIYRTYLGSNGKPTYYKGAIYASWKAEYDTYGNRIMEAIFDTRGKPVNYKGANYASWKAEYDKNGNKTMEAYFDIYGRPINYNNDYNYASWKAEYDTYGNRIMEAIFDVSGKSMNYRGENYASWKAEYDINGNLIRISYFDVNGKLIK